MAHEEVLPEVATWQLLPDVQASVLEVEMHLARSGILKRLLQG